ncbi:aldehyde dehydrogenase family protein [Nocardia sp. NPDC127606]|uniref:aldehyde dehydrogenase family protein n=1 Tax=Nocardia sp. NPDC127606 TaxID=3345406 RepID=UPI0036372C84
MTSVDPTANRADIEVRNPADGRVVGTVPNDSPDIVAAKGRALRAAQPEWEALGPKGRKVWMLRYQDWLIDNAGRIADVVQSETSKPRLDASIEGPAAADIFGFYARRAERFMADRHPTPHSPAVFPKRLAVVYRPYPVVGVITPWNFPFGMPALDIPPALAAGAAVLLKPSEVTPLSGVLLVQGWKEIGAPPVLEVTTGAGDTGAAVVDSVDYVQFTGSTHTGRIIAQRAGELLKPCSLELGGKDAALVLADADLDRAANGIAWGGMFNAGQVCISVERVYVEAPVYDDFLAKLTKNVEELRQGQDGDSYRFDVGALATPAQLAVVKRHVDEAVAAGATVVTGGRPTGVGNFFAPTVLVDVDHSMSCIREETFGPTLPVIKVADEAEAIRLANDSEFGLSATVWSNNKTRAARVARQLEVGAVNINDAFSNLFNFTLPMGGWKTSGIGTRFGGAAAVHKYCRSQAITTPRIPTTQKELLWYPYSRRKALFTLGILRSVTSRGLRKFGVSPRGRQ